MLPCPSGALHCGNDSRARRVPQVATCATRPQRATWSFGVARSLRSRLAQVVNGQRLACNTCEGNVPASNRGGVAGSRLPAFARGAGIRTHSGACGGQVISSGCQRSDTGLAALSGLRPGRGAKLNSCIYIITLNGCQDHKLGHLHERVAYFAGIGDVSPAPHWVVC